MPAANISCTATCGVRAALTISPPGGARCPGQPLTLSAEASEAAGCTGTLQYRFTGPGLDTGYTSSPTATASAAGAATWTVAVRCSADTSCAQSIAVADPTLDDFHAGRVRPGSLRVSRQGDDVLLSWEGTAAPVAYATFRTDSAREDTAARIAALRDLALSPPPGPLRHGSADALTLRDAGAAHDGTGLHVYRVLTRIPCAGTALDR